MLRATD